MFDIEIDKYFRTIAFRQSKYLQDLKHEYPSVNFEMTIEEAEKYAKTISVYRRSDITGSLTDSIITLQLKCPLLTRVSGYLEQIYMLEEEVGQGLEGKLNNISMMYSDIFKHEWTGDSKMGMMMCIEEVINRTSRGPLSMWTDYERAIDIFYGAQKRAFLDAVLKFNLEISGTTSRVILSSASEDLERLSAFVKMHSDEYNY